MSEPVKIVVFVKGGTVIDVMTCGVPVEVAVIDEDDIGAGQLIEQYPTYSDTKETDTFPGYGFVWRLNGGQPTYDAYALKCFNIARAASIAEEK